MKEFKYTIIGGIGPVQTHKHGTVKDLLFDVPYFFLAHDIIPTLPIINDLLRKGLIDSGMSGGCRWTPFEISEDEYDELVEDLLTEPQRNLSLVKVPVYVSTFEQWIVFKAGFQKKDR